MLAFALTAVHVMFSGAAFGLFGYLYLVQSWNVLTNAFRSQYVGIIVATWGLFQGASGIQLARQGFGSGKAHFSEFLLFFLLWASEAGWITLVILVGIGGNFDYYQTVTGSNAIPISILVLFSLVGVTMIVQLLYWVVSCGKGAHDSDYELVSRK